MILHICPVADWAGGLYRPASLAESGFLHCSDPGTTTLPANALYRGRTDLVLLEIDPALLGVPVRWEEGDPPHPAGVWFPHVFGPIRPEAVVAVHPFPPEPDGTFRLPGAIANR
ncbi:MAG TPA: DUF952 domain-containing protein [Amycolatopsis sp.]|nr:DUF952 domain-containing protein [Amycolatopsis sp.]